ncbi:MAG: uspa protein [Modestobacter sp.]|nr:uspa protein [Modestobacter sp.]
MDQAPLRLIHALPSPFSGIRTSAATSDVLAALRASAEDVLRSVAAEVSSVAGAGGVTWSVREGRSIEVLRAASAEAQLLVLGSRGVGGVAGLLLGSTASGVVTRTSCPVIVLPDDTTVWVSERRSVVVGVEGRPGDDAVIAFAVDEAAALRTDVIALHAWQETELDPTYLSVGPLVDWAGFRADEGRVLTDALAGWRDKQPDVVIREVVLRDRAAHGLVAAALTAQLLVVGYPERNRIAALTSTTHGVLHRAACPVAVIPLKNRQEE